MNREEWLTRVAAGMEPLFKKKGYFPGKYRVTCGWPCRNATSLRRRAIGECHNVKMSKGGVAEVFISPTLDNPLEVAGVIAHELIHVSVGTEDGHGKKFKAACSHLGLVGKLTSAKPGAELNDALSAILEPLGKYPHEALTFSWKKVARKAPLKLLTCPNCGCEVKMTHEWLEEAGVPRCHCGERFEVEEG